ncbi:MAG: hypothetical protein AABX70_02660 [Nanoarchaeota archaeon]
MKNEWILLSVLFLIGLPGIMGVTPNTKLTQTRTGEGLHLIDLTPYSIPGGTRQYLTKSRFLQAQMKAYAEQYPYDLKASVSWIRSSHISLIDPISKRSLLVSLLSDDAIIGYLLQPWGRQLSGINYADLPPRTTQIVIMQAPSGRMQYQFWVSLPIQESMLNAQVKEGMKKALNTAAPQTKVDADEIAWAKMNLAHIYNPTTKAYVKVMTASAEELSRLLKMPKVRESVGLPPLKTPS